MFTYILEEYKGRHQKQSMWLANNISLQASISSHLKQMSNVLTDTSSTPLLAKKKKQPSKNSGLTDLHRTWLFSLQVSNVPIILISNACAPIAYDPQQKPGTPSDRQKYTAIIHKQSLPITMAIILIKQLLYFRPITCNKITPKHHAAQPAFQSCLLTTDSAFF